MAMKARIHVNEKFSESIMIVFMMMIKLLLIPTIIFVHQRFTENSTNISINIRNKGMNETENATYVYKSLLFNENFIPKDDSSNNILLTILPQFKLLDKSDSQNSSSSAG